MRMFLFTLVASLAAASTAVADDAKNLGRFDASDDESTELVNRRYYGGYNAGYYGRPAYGYGYRYNTGYNYGRYNSGYNYGYARNFSYYAPRPYYYNAPRYYGGWCGISETPGNIAAVLLTLKGVEPVAPVTRNDPLNLRFQPPVELPAPQAAPAKPVEDLKVSLPAAKAKYQFKAYGEK